MATRRIYKVNEATVSGRDTLIKGLGLLHDCGACDESNMWEYVENAVACVGMCVCVLGSVLGVRVAMC